MSRVALVSPSEKGILTNAGDRLPLGLLYIAGQVEKNHDVDVFDLNHTPQADLMEYIQSTKPDVIGVSCLTTPMIKRANALIRKIAGRGSRVVVGGYHPSIRPQDFPGADNVVIGEGEHFMEASPESAFIQPPKPYLAALPGPRRGLLNPDDYSLDLMGKRATTMLTSRGCPNHCTFCGNMNHQVRTHAMGELEKELDTIKYQGYDAVYILDDVFTINKERVQEIGTALKQRDLTYRCTTRANYVNTDLAAVLAATGCDLVSMGIESGSNLILDKAGKNQRVPQIERAVDLLRQHGVQSKGFFIFGLPGETEHTARQTIKFSEHLRDLGMTQADFYPLVPFPGTPIANAPEKFGKKILSRDYSKYLQACNGVPEVVIETEGLSRDRIRDYLVEAKERWQS